MKCIEKAWNLHAEELKQFLYARLNDMHIAEDILQDVFIKALNEGKQFCILDNTRAWLFRVTRNCLIDYQRTHKSFDDIPDKLFDIKALADPVINLSECLPLALQTLSSKDHEIIQLCDLQGMNQTEFAELKKLPLANVKSRIRRARRKLRETLAYLCEVTFDSNGRVFDYYCDTAIKESPSTEIIAQCGQ